MKFLALKNCEFRNTLWSLQSSTLRVQIPENSEETKEDLGKEETIVLTLLNGQIEKCHII